MSNIRNIRGYDKLLEQDITVTSDSTIVFSNTAAQAGNTGPSAQIGQVATNVASAGSIDIEASVPTTAGAPVEGVVRDVDEDGNVTLQVDGYALVSYLASAPSSYFTPTIGCPLVCDGSGGVTAPAATAVDPVASSAVAPFKAICKAIDTTNHKVLMELL